MPQHTIGLGLSRANDFALRTLIYEYLTLLFSTKFTGETDITDVDITVRDSFLLGRDFRADNTHRNDVHLLVEVRREVGGGHQWREPVFEILFNQEGAYSVLYFNWEWETDERSGGRAVVWSTYHLKNAMNGYTHLDLAALFQHFRDQIDSKKLFAG